LTVAVGYKILLKLQNTAIVPD